LNGGEPARRLRSPREPNAHVHAARRGPSLIEDLDHVDPGAGHQRDHHRVDRPGSLLAIPVQQDGGAAGATAAEALSSLPLHLDRIIDPDPFAHLTIPSSAEPATRPPRPSLRKVAAGRAAWSAPSR